MAEPQDDQYLRGTTPLTTAVPVCAALLTSAPLLFNQIIDQIFFHRWPLEG